MNYTSWELIALGRPPLEVSGAEKATNTQLIQSPLKLVESQDAHGQPCTSH